MWESGSFRVVEHYFVRHICIDLCVRQKWADAQIPSRNDVTDMLQHQILLTFEDQWFTPFTLFYTLHRFRDNNEQPGMEHFVY